jgi:hypothetical protein
MQEPQASPRQAAVDPAVAESTAAKAAEADPLDGVSTDLFGLGELKPSMTPQEFEDAKQRLSQAVLLPSTVVELMALARQVAAALAGA